MKLNKFLILYLLTLSCIKKEKSESIVDAVQPKQSAATQEIPVKLENSQETFQGEHIGANVIYLKGTPLAQSLRLLFPKFKGGIFSRADRLALNENCLHTDESCITNIKKDKPPSLGYFKALRKGATVVCNNIINTEIAAPSEENTIVTTEEVTEESISQFLAKAYRYPDNTTEIIVGAKDLADAFNAVVEEAEDKVKAKKEAYLLYCVHALNDPRFFTR